MDLYIVRHGVAEESTALGSDAARALTDEGRKKTARVARGLAALEIEPEVILTSPLVRARQTADILSGALRPKDGVSEVKWLEAGASPAEAVRQLARLKHDSVMIVGHMPDLSVLASMLLSGKPSVKIAFKKAAVCALSFDGRARTGRGRLEWLMQPRHLRAASAPKKEDDGGGGE